jgi:F0F1-type ATP synthase assembly protein I
MDVSLLQALVLAPLLGITLGVAVLIGVLGGSFLDSQLGTRPWFLLVGSLVGLAAGIYSCMQLLQSVVRLLGPRRQ